MQAKKKMQNVFSTTKQTNSTSGEKWVHCYVVFQSGTWSVCWSWPTK